MEEANQPVAAPQPVEQPVKVIDQVTPVNTNQQPTQQHVDESQQTNPEPVVLKHRAFKPNLAVVFAIVAIVILIGIAILAYHKTN